MKKSKIYIIKNKINNYVYIGKTVESLIKRFKRHLYDSKKINTKFYNAINKYGQENFYIELIVDNVEHYYINSFEKYWINKFDSFKNGYNSTKGGDGCTEHTTETLKKISIKTKQNMTKERKETISKQIKKLWENEEYRELQTNKKKGKITSNETKIKLSNANKGKKKPIGFRKGIILSKETKNKMGFSKNGIKNPASIPLTLFNNNDEPIFTILYRPYEYLKKNNFPTSLLDTYLKNTKLYESLSRLSNINKLINEKKYIYKGWYMRKALNT